MAIIKQNGVSPESMMCAAEAIYEGKVYKEDGSGRMTVITGQTDTALAVAIESSINIATGGALTMTVGVGMPFMPLNSNVVVGVCSKITETWSYGALVYLSDDVDGAVSTSTGSSAKCIGTYVGKDGLVTAVSLELINVRLDRTPGATT